MTGQTGRHTDKLSDLGVMILVGRTIKTRGPTSSSRSHRERCVLRDGFEGDNYAVEVSRDRVS